MIRPAPKMPDQNRLRKASSACVARRVNRLYSANIVAEASGSRAAAENTPVPGCRITSTPARPAAMASQRASPTFSPSTGPDRATMISGQTAKTACVSISPIRV